MATAEPSTPLSTSNRSVSSATCMSPQRSSKDAATYCSTPLSANSRKSKRKSKKSKSKKRSTASAESPAKRQKSENRWQAAHDVEVFASPTAKSTCSATYRPRLSYAGPSRRGISSRASASGRLSLSLANAERLGRRLSRSSRVRDASAQTVDADEVATEAAATAEAQALRIRLRGAVAEHQAAVITAARLREMNTLLVGRLKQHAQITSGRKSSSRVQLMGALNSKEDEVLALKARLTMADTKIAELRAHGKTVAQAAATVKASQRTLSEQCRRLAKSLSEATLRSRHTAARHAAAIRDTELAKSDAAAAAAKMKKLRQLVRDARADTARKAAELAAWQADVEQHQHAATAAAVEEATQPLRRSLEELQAEVCATKLQWQNEVAELRAAHEAELGSTKQRLGEREESIRSIKAGWEAEAATMRQQHQTLAAELSQAVAMAAQSERAVAEAQAGAEAAMATCTRTAQEAQRVAAAKAEAALAAATARAQAAEEELGAVKAHWQLVQTEHVREVRALQEAAAAEAARLEACLANAQALAAAARDEAEAARDEARLAQLQQSSSAAELQALKRVGAASLERVGGLLCKTEERLGNLQAAKVAQAARFGRQQKCTQDCMTAMQRKLVAASNDAAATQHEVASLKQTISDMEVQAGLDQATQHALQKQLEAAVVAQDVAASPPPAPAAAAPAAVAALEATIAGLKEECEQHKSRATDAATRLAAAEQKINKLMRNAACLERRASRFHREARSSGATAAAAQRQTRGAKAAAQSATDRMARLRASTAEHKREARALAAQADSAREHGAAAQRSMRVMQFIAIVCVIAAYFSMLFGVSSSAAC